MATLVPCATCLRHLRASETACPFCGSTREVSAEVTLTPIRLSRAAGVALRVVLGVGAPSAVACAAASPAPDIVATREVSPAPSSSTSPKSSASGSASASASAMPPEHHHVVPIYGNSSFLILDRVYFEVNSAVVSKASEPLLEAIAQTFKGLPTWYVAIEPRAETVEGKDAAARLALSKKRGEAIAAKLVAFGVDAKHIRVIPLGDTKPLSTGKTADDRARNRSTSFRPELEDGSAPVP